jgi:hypothetical protein
MEAAALPSQNRQQQIQQQEHHPVPHGSYPAAPPPGTMLTPQLQLQLQTLVRNGQKLEAIRLLRQATHSNLLTAKQYVDRL